MTHDRTIPMRGFTAAVSRGDMPLHGLPAGGVAFGFDGEGADRVLVIAIRHSDGTVLTAYLGEAQCDRAGELIEQLHDPDRPRLFPVLQ